MIPYKGPQNDFKFWKTGGLVLIMLVVLFIMASCATLGDDPRYNTKQKLTADYLAMKTKLLDTKGSIEMACPAIPITQCVKAKRYYNVAADSYIVAGYYFMAWNDPVNYFTYLNQAALKTVQMKEQWKKYLDLLVIVQAIDRLMDMKDSEPVGEAQLVQTLIILETQIIDAVFDMLQMTGAIGDN